MAFLTQCQARRLIAARKCNHPLTCPSASPTKYHKSESIFESNPLRISPKFVHTLLCAHTLVFGLKACAHDFLATSSMLLFLLMLFALRQWSERRSTRVINGISRPWKGADRSKSELSHQITQIANEAFMDNTRVSSNGSLYNLPASIVLYCGSGVVGEY